MKVPKRFAKLRRPERVTKPGASAALSKSRLQRDLGRDAPSEESSEVLYPVVVYTKEELADATRRKARRIVVKGELASKISTCTVDCHLEANSHRYRAFCLFMALMITTKSLRVIAGTAQRAVLGGCLLKGGTRPYRSQDFGVV